MHSRLATFRLRAPEAQWGRHEKREHRDAIARLPTGLVENEVQAKAALVSAAPVSFELLVKDQVDLAQAPLKLPAGDLAKVILGGHY